MLEHYYRKGYKLSLNGDIDELLKFDLETIIARWQRKNLSCLLG